MIYEIRSLLTGIIFGLVVFALIDHTVEPSTSSTKTDDTKQRTGSYYNEKLERPIDNGDWNMAFLFPDEIAAARMRNGLVILPVGPVEWHGSHLVM